MKKDDLIILLIALLLLGGMLITIFFSGAKSRHGVGLRPDGKTKHLLSFQKDRTAEPGPAHPAGDLENYRSAMVADSALDNLISADRSVLTKIG